MIKQVMPTTDDKDDFAFFLRWKKMAESIQNRVKRVQKTENAWAKGRSFTVTPSNPEENLMKKLRAKELRRKLKWARDDEKAKKDAYNTYDALGLDKAERRKREKARLDALSAKRAAAGPVLPQRQRYVVGLDPALDKAKIAERAAKNREYQARYQAKKRAKEDVNKTLLSNYNKSSKKLPSLERDGRKEPRN
jgi:hypothetical protein